jgi:N4-gp56 family major capsid protein
LIFQKSEERKMNKKFYLQMFANPNTQVTTMNTPGNDMSPEMKAFYDTQLLENARKDHYFNQFGQEQSIPRGFDGKVEFRKIDTFAPATTPLVEGVTPDGQSINFTKLEAQVNQYGAYTTLSDLVETRTVDPVVMQVTEESGAQAADTLDIITRNEVTSGTNVMFGGGKTARHLLTASDTLTATLVNKINTNLKKNKAPKINGDYICIIHPSVAEDLRESSAWLEVHKYAQPTEIYNGEIGKLHNIRFIESTETKVEKGADLSATSRTLTVSSVASNVVTVSETLVADALVGRYVILKAKHWYVKANDTSTITLVDDVDKTTAAVLSDVSANDVVYPGEGGAAGIAIYECIAFGKDAYGRIKPTAESLEMIIKQKGSAGSADPLNQRSTIGWKASHGAKILYEERIVRVEVGSSYSSVDDAN